MSKSSTKIYLAEYAYGNSVFSVKIPAESWDDARARLTALQSGTIYGELDSEFDATRPAIFWEKIKAWFSN